MVIGPFFPPDNQFADRPLPGGPNVLHDVNPEKADDLRPLEAGIGTGRQEKCTGGQEQAAKNESE
jgi:hypothetical protein